MKSFKRQINAAFKELDAAGIFARQNFWCCQSCGWADVPDTAETAVFYHRQDTPGIKEGNLYLAHRGDTGAIVHILSRHVNVHWDGTEYKRILITPKEQV